MASHINEYNDLLNEFGNDKVNFLFPSGLKGYIKSRKQGNYSLESIKHTLTL